MKKEKIKTGIAYGLCASVLIAGIYYYQTDQENKKEKTQSITYLDVGFDTVVNFSSTCTEKEFETYSQIVRDTFSQYNQYFDLYNAYEGVNNINKINQEAYQNPISIDAPLEDCIQLAMKVNLENRKFDISQGKLLNVWHTFREQGMALNQEGKDGILPSKEILDQAYNPNINGIALENHAISFTESSVQLDLGGIAKGYTAQKAKEKLWEAGCDNGYINAGGNVVLLGEKTDGTSWKIGVESPKGGTALFSIETQKPTSMVASGDYQRYFMVEGQMYGHIIDPDTRYPAKHFRSVTILHEDSGLADAYSTLLFTMDFETGYLFAKKHNLDVTWIMDQNSIGNLTPDFVSGDFAIFCTDSLKDRIQI
ncbi:MAG: FAD:protein FMN transferase [Bacillota bacterium]|nr:FAD:protein FMN transferase [Bacillota bacterium]